MTGPIVITAAGETVTVAQPVVTDAPPPGWVLAWSDEFSGATVDGSKWGVYNNTTLSYDLATVQASNATVAAGSLTITARKQAVGGRLYTTGYLHTIGKFSQSYGRWEIRAQLPPVTAKGLWPAFWLRCDTTLGEIDILEWVAGYRNVVQTVHQSTNGDQDKSGYEWVPPTGFAFTDFHVYALERDPDGAVRWYVDGALTRSRRPADLDNQGKPMSWLSGPTFASPLNIRLNLQVGDTGHAMPSYYGVNVDATTVLPAQFVVDYVRVYRQAL